MPDVLRVMSRKYCPARSGAVPGGTISSWQAIGHAGDHEAVGTGADRGGLSMDLDSYQGSFSQLACVSFIHEKGAEKFYDYT